MKKIVDGKLYDTGTAESLGEWEDSLKTYSLYKTRKGAYFAVTKLSLADESNPLPLAEDEVFDWLLDNGGDEQAARLFPDRVEEA